MTLDGAIMQLAQMRESYYMPTMFKPLFDKVIETVSECEEPGTSTVPQWIPCSERLPGVGQSVLMSVGGMYTAEGCLREDGNWAQFRWDAVQRKDMVGAWMPLPEPWKEEQGE